MTAGRSTPQRKRPGPIAAAVMKTINDGMSDAHWRCDLPKRKGPRKKASLQYAFYGNEDNATAARESRAMDLAERRRLRHGWSPKQRVELFP